MLESIFQSLEVGLYADGKLEQNCVYLAIKWHTCGSLHN